MYYWGLSSQEKQVFPLVTGVHAGVGYRNKGINLHGSLPKSSAIKGNLKISLLALQ